jgi:hypothetical protein
VGRKEVVFGCRNPAEERAPGGRRRAGASAIIPAAKLQGVVMTSPFVMIGLSAPAVQGQRILCMERIDFFDGASCCGAALSAAC